MEDGGLPAMASAALAELRKAAQLEGVAILDFARPDSASVLLFDAGPGVPDAIGSAHQLLRRSPDAVSFTVAPDKRPILVAPWVLHPDRRGGLALWRTAGGVAWEERDRCFAASVAGLMRIILEYGPGEASIDRLTGLPNRGFFLGEVNRHIDRLEQDGTSGTMLLIDLDGLRRVNTSHGRAVGDDVLTRTATLLRAMVRPVDIVARVGGDEFAVWLDGMDHMTAAERAVGLAERRLALPEAVDAAGRIEKSRMDSGHMKDGPVEGPQLEMTLSIGIASRRLGDGEDARALLRRAHKALWDAKQAGGGGWAVSRVLRG
ncbi:MAG: GGDEF domain-containing protein [Acetobacteraceae bacterium]|nr:GGDEF domain-containing protein [Acetobacteraceae bacterium]